MTTRNWFAAELTADPEELRGSLLRVILRGCAILGGAVYLPSVYLAVVTRSFGIAAVDTIALAVVFALLVFDRLPFRLRATVLCLIFYVLGVGLLLGVGPISQIYLFGFSILTTILLGLRVGLASAMLSSVSLLAIGGLGYASTGMTGSHHGFAFPGWIITTMNFALVDVVLTLAIGAVLAGMNDALAREIAQRLSLARERALLRTLIDALPDVVFTKDADGRFVKANAATLALMGLETEEQLAGKTVFELFSRELAEPYNVPWK